MQTVAPARCSARSSSITASPLVESRFPVGSFCRREVGDRLVLQQVAAIARRIEQAEDGEERRFAASRRTIDRDVLALADLEVYVRERMRLDFVGEKDLADALELNERRTI